LTAKFHSRFVKESEILVRSESVILTPTPQLKKLLSIDWSGVSFTAGVCNTRAKSAPGPEVCSHGSGKVQIVKGHCQSSVGGQRVA